MELIGLKHWKTFQANYLKPLLQQGVLAMTIPEKPTISLYRQEGNHREYPLENK
jgi:hypothetical protein